MQGTSSCTQVRKLMIGAAMLAGIAACASGPAPEAEMGAAELALSQAEDAEAAALAPAPYALARDKLERARDAMADGENIERLREELAQRGPTTS